VSYEQVIYPQFRPIQFKNYAALLYEMFYVRGWEKVGYTVSMKIWYYYKPNYFIKK
jgi:hypothetical protein